MAYTTFYLLGLIMSMQVPFVGFQPIRTSEHMAAAGVCVCVCVCVCVPFLTLLCPHSFLDHSLSLPCSHSLHTHSHFPLHTPSSHTPLSRLPPHTLHTNPPHSHPIGVFALVNAYAILKFLQSRLTGKQFRKLFFFTVATSAGLVFVAVVGLTYLGYIAPWSGRFYSLYDTGYALCCSNGVM